MSARGTKRREGGRRGGRESPVPRGPGARASTLGTRQLGLRPLTGLLLRLRTSRTAPPPLPRQCRAHRPVRADCRLSAPRCGWRARQRSREGPRRAGARCAPRAAEGRRVPDVRGPFAGVWTQVVGRGRRARSTSPVLPPFRDPGISNRGSCFTPPGSRGPVPRSKPDPVLAHYPDSP